MTFAASGFKTLVAGLSQIHHYNTADAIATVAGSGYFNSITNRLKQYDIIIAATSTGGTLAVDMLIVSSATGAATVTTTNGT